MSRSRVRLALALALWAGTAALFLPIRHHDFVPLDDPQYVANNPELQYGLSPAGLRRTFTTAYFYNWHPLTTLSYAVDYRLHGRTAGGYLLTNLLLHATSTLLLFLALERMTGALGRSAFVAAVFGIHPLHVESVAWVSERKDVLSAFFFMTVLWAYASAVRGANSWRWRAAVTILLALGLLAKPMLVTAPFVLLLLDFWPLGRIPTRSPREALQALGPLVLEKLPLFALAGALSVVTYVVQSSAGAVASFQSLPLTERLLNIPCAYLGYLEKAFWPHDLAIYYALDVKDLWLGRTLLALAVLAAITALAIARWRRAPYLLMGWLWFLGMLVPVIGLVQVGGQALADRYAYLPLIGVAIAVTWGAAELAQGMRHRRSVLAAGAMACVLAMAVTTTLQIRTWQDALTVTERALAVTRECALMHSLHGYALAELRGDTAGAEKEYRRALEMWPDFGDAQINLGLLLTRTGRPAEAESHLRRALALGVKTPDLHAALGETLLREGRSREAVDELRAALRVRPDWVEIENNLAWTLATEQDPAVRSPDEAVALAERAAELSGRQDPSILDTLAVAYAAAGRHADALATARDALSIARSQGKAQLAGTLEQRVRDYQAEGASASP